MIEFTISGDPLISIGSLGSLYENFKGTSTLNPSTLQKNHDFAFKDEIAGISKVDIEGPNGSIWSRSFASPVQSTGTSFENMPPGQYVAKTKNSTGNETIAPFNIGSLNVYVSTPSSKQTINYSADPLGASTADITVKIEVESYNQLDRIELIDFFGKILETKPLSGNSASVDFNLSQIEISDPLFLNVEGYIPPYGAYVAKVYDDKGNYKRDFFNVALAMLSRESLVA